MEEVPAELLKPPALAPPTATLTPAIEAKAYFDSGLAFLNRKEYDKAIGDFTEAIRLDPNYALAYLNRGLEYDYRGNYVKAVTAEHQISLNLFVAVAFRYSSAFVTSSDSGFAVVKVTCQEGPNNECGKAKKGPDTSTRQAAPCLSMREQMDCTLLV